MFYSKLLFSLKFSSSEISEYYLTESSEEISL